jgi:hypothetical protein
LGLGLASDYGLFIVGRFRDELARSGSTEAALARTMATAGRTVKAVVMNVLSVSASFGVVVWVFQWGHLSWLLRFTPTGTIDPSIPILMLAITFGLSMDYEVFLLSRIREHYDITGDNTAAVASGLQRTGGIITSAALLLVIVVAAFSASGITFIKLMGVGMIVALIVDATIVRVLLVPATMRLLGGANWYTPRPLRRLYARYGVREGDHPGSAELPARRDEGWSVPAGKPGFEGLQRLRTVYPALADCVDDEEFTADWGPAARASAAAAPVRADLPRPIVWPAAYWSDPAGVSPEEADRLR